MQLLHDHPEGSAAMGRDDETVAVQGTSAIRLLCLSCDQVASSGRSSLSTEQQCLLLAYCCWLAGHQGAGGSVTWSL